LGHTDANEILGSLI